VARVELAMAAVEDLEGIIRTHSLPSTAATATRR
jgi:hypothetical protein